MSRKLTLLTIVSLISVSGITPLPAESSFEKFAASAKAENTLPASLSNPLRALWLAKSGNWRDAHSLAQNMKCNTGSWIHAFLHREEGDLANAGYWYRRAGMTRPGKLSIEEEWSLIARELWQREHGTTPGQEILTSTKGLVASCKANTSGEEGEWDTLIHQDDDRILSIPNARPISFSPCGEILLLIEAAADDDCRHFIVRISRDAKIPEFGQRKRIGERIITAHQWSEDSTKLTLSFRDSEALKFLVSESLSNL